RLEAVLDERLVLRPDLLPLFEVARDPDAPDPPERVACERLHAVDVALRQQPERTGAVRPELQARDVIRHRAAPEGEAAVAPARAGGDLARLVDADAQARLSEHARTGAARDAAADHDDVGTPLDPPRRTRRRLLGEPEGVRHLSESTPRASPP